ncbi:DNA repair protein [Jeotgalibacillus soli]|uniref:DNA repair protein n=1 Tax=Jeotgalibacillus soli TaxID=889306 RepID=A0A0C2R5D4_9BACL|nr:DNA repair protein [Jeotgalibacillus soli]
MLIDQLTTAFDPKKYHNDYRTALMDLIEEKKFGEYTVTPSEDKNRPAASNVTDLMSALQASLDKTKKKRPAPR